MAKRGGGDPARVIGDIFWLLYRGIFVAWLWLALAHPAADAKLVARVMTDPRDAGCAARDFLRISYFVLADIITVPICQSGTRLVAAAPVGKATRTAGGIVVTLDVPPVVLAGEPVAVTLRVRDATSQPVEVPAMRLVVLSPAGRTAWTDRDATTPIAVTAQDQLTMLCSQDLALRCLAPGALATVRRVPPHSSRRGATPWW